MYENVLPALVVAAVILYVVHSVATSSKSLASFVQLGELQRRDEVYSASKSPSPPKTASTTARKTASSSAIETLPMPLAYAANDSNREKMVKRVSFMLGLMNVGVSGFIIGAYPTMYYLWYTPKAVIFCLARWIDFRKQKRHYLLYDFCYWANAALLLYLWVLPHSASLFQICFLAANGPLAWSILAFNQALVLHQWQQVVSVFIHVAPMILTFPSSFVVCGDFPSCADTSPASLFQNALLRFYIWWIVLYWIWIFYFLGDYMQTKSFKTLYDRVSENQLKFLFGSDSKAIFGSFHPLAKKTIYMGVHLVFGMFTMLLATCFWYFWWAQFVFICLMISMSCFNASKFYLTTFEVELTKAT